MTAKYTGLLKGSSIEEESAEQNIKSDDLIPIRATYIWPDGQRPTSKLRNKEKPLYVKKSCWKKWREATHGKIQSRLNNPFSPQSQRLYRYGDTPEWVPSWAFDGSSTFQAETAQSDCGLEPVYVIPDPILGDPHILVLCEVLHSDGNPHVSNTRAILREAVQKYKHEDPFIGFEQEYTLYDKDGQWPYRWPQGGGYPEPQGKFYGSVGSDEAFGKELIDTHTDALIAAGLRYDGTNAEVMPSQWEFQIGPLPALTAADELLLSRFILYHLGGQMGIAVKLSPKPIAGDWNGAGCHANFSTAEMRNEGGIASIYKATEKLGDYRAHREHIWVYGEHNILRLTGAHETCRIDQFRVGVGHRGCSVRINSEVERREKGYFEDRRPAANIDPYMVATALLETVCGDGFDHHTFGYFFDDDHQPSWRHNVIMRGLFGK